MRFRTVALASYPRSGNTWMRHLLHAAAGLKSRYALNPEDGKVHQAGAIPEIADEGAALVKTHGLDAVNYEGAVHIVRNPIVAISSYLDYCREFTVPIPAQREFVEREARGWLKHTEHWRMARECGVGIEYQPVLYEDLCEFTFLMVRRVCRFLGANATDARIAHAARTLTLEAMQKRGTKGFYPKGFERNPTTNLTLADVRIIRHTCGDEMKRWGYQ